MKSRGFILIVIAVAVSVAPLLVNTSKAAGGYSAQLISPVAGQVVYPGQRIRVEWRSVLPPINLGACETEVFLSLDGGHTFTMWISPWMNPKAQYFDWTVPNTPTNQAVLQIRFGCEPGYPESFAPQPASTFTIANALPSS
jgi:hypothetical protein